MAPKLYVLPASPAVRAVLLTAKAIDLELDLEFVDLFKKEHLRRSFREMNPQHTVPTLKDGDFIIWDSHAIMGYLIHKYAQNDSLYPKDPCKRAIVDQRLHFDSGVLLKRFNELVVPILHIQKMKTIPKENIEMVHEAYGLLEEFIRGKKWIAGDFLSIADFSIISTTTSLNLLIPIDSRKYPNLVSYMFRCEQLPHYEVNSVGLDQLSELLQNKLSE